MKLVDYLVELESCPDEDVPNWYESEFNKRLGLYDNFHILLSADYEEVFNDLIIFPGQKFLELSGFMDGCKGLKYCPGSIILQVEPLLQSNIGGRLRAWGCSRDQEHLARQVRDFKSKIILFPYQKGTKIPGVIDSLKAMAIVIKEIAELAKLNKLSMCMPRAAHYSNYSGYPNEEDLSRIVYYYPGENKE